VLSRPLWQSFRAAPGRHCGPPRAPRLPDATNRRRGLQGSEDRPGRRLSLRAVFRRVSGRGHSKPRRSRGHPQPRTSPLILALGGLHPYPAPDFARNLNCRHLLSQFRSTTIELRRRDPKEAATLPEGMAPPTQSYAFSSFCHRYFQSHRIVTEHVLLPKGEYICTIKKEAGSQM
jgi:hypothetical protein